MKRSGRSEQEDSSLEEWGRWVPRWVKQLNPMEDFMSSRNRVAKKIARLGSAFGYFPLDPARNQLKRKEALGASEPVVENFMTTEIVTIEEKASIQQAFNLMIGHDLRHLPVVTAEGVITGILSERDVLIVHSEGKEKSVREVMVHNPYVVHPDAPLKEVVRAMERHKYGCVIVTNYGDKPIGIFTVVDALRAFEHLLR